MSAASSRGRPSSSASKAVHLHAPGGHPQHRPDQRPDHVAHEAVGLYPVLEHVAPVDPFRAEDLAVEARVVAAGGGEGGEVVSAEHSGGTGLQPLPIARPAPVQAGASLVGRAGPAGEHPVAVGARAGVAAGVEAVGGLLAAHHRHVVGQDPVQPRGGDRCARVAGHLPPSVHTRIGAPRHGERNRLAGDGGERRLERLLHGAAARLGGPAGEVRPVVLDEQPGGQPGRRATITAYSPSTENGPSPPAHLRATSTISSRIWA